MDGVVCQPSHVGLTALDVTTRTLISREDLCVPKFPENGEKSFSSLGTFLYFFVCHQKMSKHNARQNPFLVYCPAAVSQFTLSVCLITGLFVWRCTGRHGCIVSEAKEENGTVTVERIGS